jgi:hypothetical protein
MRSLYTVLLLAVVWAPAARAGDALLQAVSFVLTGSDGQPVEMVDRKDCVFRLGVRTYYINNVITDRMTFQKWTRQLGGDYIRVGLHGKAKIMEEAYAGTVYPVTDHELFVESPDYDRVIRAWQYIYANGCKRLSSPF